MQNIVLNNNHLVLGNIGLCNENLATTVGNLFSSFFSATIKAKNNIRTATLTSVYMHLIDVYIY